MHLKQPCRLLKKHCYELREHYAAIQPGYHMNKRHWNTVLLNGSLPQELLIKLIEHSYRLVVLTLPRSLRHHYLAALEHR